MPKKSMVLALVACLCLSFANKQAFAQDTFSGDDPTAGGVEQHGEPNTPGLGEETEEEDGDDGSGLIDVIDPGNLTPPGGGAVATSGKRAWFWCTNPDPSRVEASASAEMDGVWKEAGCVVNAIQCGKLKEKVDSDLASKVASAACPETNCSIEATYDPPQECDGNTQAGTTRTTGYLDNLNQPCKADITISRGAGLSCSK